MSTSRQEYIVAGKMGAAYGIKGWLKVHSFTEAASNILQYNPWYIGEDERWQVLAVEDGKPHGKGLIVKLKGIETPEAARTLAGKAIAIKREQLAPLPPDEYYWADLEGLTVINQHGVALGQISYLLATGSNDVLVVKDVMGKEHAIPYLPHLVVKKIDLREKRMFVDWDLI